MTPLSANGLPGGGCSGCCFSVIQDSCSCTSLLNGAPSMRSTVVMPAHPFTLHNCCTFIPWLPAAPAYGLSIHGNRTFPSLVSPRLDGASFRTGWKTETRVDLPLTGIG